MTNKPASVNSDVGKNKPNEDVNEESEEPILDDQATSTANSNENASDDVPSTGHVGNEYHFT